MSDQSLHNQIYVSKCGLMEFIVLGDKDGKLKVHVEYLDKGIRDTVIKEKSKFLEALELGRIKYVKTGLFTAINTIEL